MPETIVTILKSDIDSADFETVLNAIDKIADALEEGEEKELRVIIKNDVTEETTEEEQD